MKLLLIIYTEAIDIGINIILYPLPKNAEITRIEILCHGIFLEDKHCRSIQYTRLCGNSATYQHE